MLPVEPDVGRVRFAPVKVAWLWTMVGLGIAGVVVATPGSVALAIALHVATVGVGHSVGLHRGIIHQAFRARPVVRGVLAYLAALSGLGGPLTWVHVHAVRDHWQRAAACPPYFGYRHGLLRDLWWNLHHVFEPRDDRALTRLPPGVLGDRWLRFLEVTWPLHVLALTLAIAAWLGPAAAATAVGTRIALGLLGHWFVTYAAHRWGDQPHVTPGASESGTNVWLLGVLSFGEGFHNHHHAYPRSARMGRAWHELDLGWLVVRALRRLRLVDDVRTA